MRLTIELELTAAQERGLLFDASRWGEKGRDATEHATEKLAKWLDDLAVNELGAFKERMVSKIMAEPLDSKKTIEEVAGSVDRSYAAVLVAEAQPALVK